MEVRLAQPEKAECPISVTELGIFIVVRPVQLLKASAPIPVTELGIIVEDMPEYRVLDAVSIIALQLFLESYMGLSSLTLIEVKAEQPPKTPLPISVTDAGISMEVRLVQPSKALIPIFATELGMFIVVRPEQ